MNEYDSRANVCKIQLDLLLHIIFSSGMTIEPINCLSFDLNAHTHIDIHNNTKEVFSTFEFVNDK